MNVADIKPYERNAKKHSEKQIKEIMRAIGAFGFNQPIVIDARGEIVVGHGRPEAAKRLGFEEVRIGAARAGKGERFVPAVMVEDLTEQEVKAYRLADNKLNESPWDMNLAIEELRGLDLEGFEVSLTGFSVDLIRDAEEDDFDLEKAVEESQKTDIQKGDLFRLGAHRLLCGDATDPLDYLRLMDGQTASMVFTDPPYNIDYQGGVQGDGKQKKRRKILNDKMSRDQFYGFLGDVMRNLVEFTRGAFYVCMSSSELHTLYGAFTEAGGHWQTYIVWAKNHFTLSRADYQHQMEPILHGLSEEEAKKIDEPEKYDAESLPILYGWTTHEWYGGRKQGNVWFFDKPNVSKEHPTMKPIALCAKAIKNSSQSKEIVLDVFGGSGSTLIACEQMQRACRMMELDPVYVSVIIKRWEKLTGKKAVKMKKKGGENL
jgi:DNA modification methylase